MGDRQSFRSTGYLFAPLSRPIRPPFAPLPAGSEPKGEALIKRRKDLYEVLGIPEDADEATIKKASSPRVP